MKQTSYSGRSHGRSSERYKQPQKRTNGDGREGGGRPRGNYQQSVDKYLTLARDAASSGDPVSAENFYQYADHYYRLVCESRPPAPQPMAHPVRERVDPPPASPETPRSHPRPRIRRPEAPLREQEEGPVPLEAALPPPSPRPRMKRTETHDHDH